MLHDLVRIHRGKELVVMTDQLLKVKRRLIAIKNSQRGMGYTYLVRPSVEVKKYKKKHKFRSH